MRGCCERNSRKVSRWARKELILVRQSLRDEIILLEIIGIEDVPMVDGDGTAWLVLDESHGTILARSSSSLMTIGADSWSPLRRTRILPCENQVYL